MVSNDKNLKSDVMLTFCTIEDDYEKDFKFKNDDEIIEYIETELIPKYSVESFDIDKETGDRTLKVTIPLKKIYLLNLSEEQLIFIFNYLNKKNIIVRGADSYLEGEFENYEYKPNQKKEIVEIESSNWQDVKLLFEQYNIIKQKLNNANETEKKEYGEQLLKLRNEIFIKNKKLVDTFISKHKEWIIPEEDVQQVAYLATLHFIDNFDVSMGYTFSSYLYFSLYGRLSRLEREERLMRVPENVVFKIESVIKAKQRLFELIGREPNMEEIALYLKMPEEKVEEYLKISNFMNWKSLTDFDSISFDDEVNLAGDFESSDELDEYVLYSPEEDNFFDSVDIEILKESVKDSLEVLSEREYKIIVYRYGLNGEAPKTLDEVGKILGITRERVRQIEHRALWRLKYNSNMKNYNVFR